MTTYNTRGGLIKIKTLLFLSKLYKNVPMNTGIARIFLLPGSKTYHYNGRITGIMCQGIVSYEKGTKMQDVSATSTEKIVWWRDVLIPPGNCPRRVPNKKCWNFQYFNIYISIFYIITTHLINYIFYLLHHNLTSAAEKMIKTNKDDSILNLYT